MAMNCPSLLSRSFSCFLSETLRLLLTWETERESGRADGKTGTAYKLYTSYKRVLRQTILRRRFSCIRLISVCLCGQICTEFGSVQIWFGKSDSLIIPISQKRAWQRLRHPLPSLPTSPCTPALPSPRQSHSPLRSVVA